MSHWSHTANIVVKPKNNVCLLNRMCHIPNRAFNTSKFVCEQEHQVLPAVLKQALKYSIQQCRYNAVLLSEIHSSISPLKAALLASNSPGAVAVLGTPHQELLGWVMKGGSEGHWDQAGSSECGSCAWQSGSWSRRGPGGGGAAGNWYRAECWPLRDSPGPGTSPLACRWPSVMGRDQGSESKFRPDRGTANTMFDARGRLEVGSEIRGCGGRCSYSPHYRMIYERGGRKYRRARI